MIVKPFVAHLFFVFQLNFILFVNIVRVLLLKLRASVCEETRTYRWGPEEATQ
jgi:hypothetical protein